MNNKTIALEQLEVTIGSITDYVDVSFEVSFIKVDNGISRVEICPEIEHMEIVEFESIEISEDEFKAWLSANKFEVEKKVIEEIDLGNLES